MGCGGWDGGGARVNQLGGSCRNVARDVGGLDQGGNSGDRVSEDTG